MRLNSSMNRFRPVFAGIQVGFFLQGIKLAGAVNATGIFFAVFR